MHIIDNTSFGSDGTKIGDMNGDGFEDIVCGWEQGNVARLYINPYPEATWEYIEVPAPDVEDAFMLDLDNDGFQDLVTFSEGDHQRITFHWAPGMNYLEEPWISQDVPCTVGLTQWMFGRAMDIDGKYGLDIVVAAKNHGAMVGWLESPADPRIMDDWKLHLITPASWVMSVEIVDVNHDGREDIVISDRNGNTNGVKWLENPGGDSAIFHPWSTHLIGMSDHDPMFLDIKEMPATKMLHIWVPDIKSQLFHFTQSDSTGHSWVVEVMPFPNGSGRVGKSATLGDLNGDGFDDLVTTYDGAKEKSGVMWSLRDTLTDTWQHFDISGKPGNKFDFAYLLDLDRDGDLDILTSEENNNSKTVPGLGVIWYENPKIK